jgi:hypothetical protein
MVYVVVILVLALAVFAVLRRRRRVVPPPPSTVEDEPPFRIVTLGTRGAGKTLFLASMFHELKTPGDRAWWLRAPADQSRTLNRWFAQVEDTTVDWPRGTTIGETRTFTFEVLTRTPSNKTRTVLRFEYLEYAGGLLTDEQDAGSTAQDELIARIHQADALICLVDGFRLRQLLDGQSEGGRRLGHSIDSMVDYVMEATCPVTFAVTKWDLFADLELDDDARLSLVAKRLRYLRAFDDLVKQHAQQRIVRLVPVSAVGNDFAEITDGMVAKRSDGDLVPTNVDVPLAAVVPDVFEQLEQEIENRQLQDEFERLRTMTRLGPGAAAAELGTFVTGLASSIWLGVGNRASAFLGDAALELFGRHGASTQKDDQGRIDGYVDTAQQELQEFRVARRRVLREWRHRVDVLEGRLPSSRLRAGDRP